MKRGIEAIPAPLAEDGSAGFRPLASIPCATRALGIAGARALPYAPSRGPLRPRHRSSPQCSGQNAQGPLGDQRAAGARKARLVVQ